MKYIFIKLFPSDKIDYVSQYFFNFLFALIFAINLPNLNSLLFFSNKPIYTLLIPITGESYEESKDLIFSRLSVNDRIISVKKIKKEAIIDRLNKKIDIELLEEDLIPEAFEIIIKKNNYLDIEKENKNIREIIKGAEILKKNTKDKSRILVSFLSISTSIIFFLILLSILQINYIKKIKAFIIKFRICGAQDSNIIFNISAGYFLLQLLGVLSGYFLIYLLETKFKTLPFLILNNIGSTIAFIFIQNIICTLSLGFFLKIQLRKVL